MNPNTSYELFTREIYQLLINAQGVKTVQVQHNVKLEGRSCQKHQIDVYWEYMIAGTTHRVAIECKNYDKPVRLSVVRNFKGVLDDLNGVQGIIVSKKGFQSGAKQYAKEWGISLKELRTPERGEAIVGEVECNTHYEKTRTLFKIDEDWATNYGYDINQYRHNLGLWEWGGDGNWTNSDYLPINTQDQLIRDVDGTIIASIDKLGEQNNPQLSDERRVIFPFDNAYITLSDSRRLKILEVCFERICHDQKRVMQIDAFGFVRAILKDAIDGEIQLI
ncbi:MAG: restriction endonuclease [Bacteroidales bacterium]|nr:restriction endonuclease [Bacteroidales bacterium]